MSGSSIRYAVLCVLSSFTIVSMRKRELVAVHCVLAAVWLLVLFVTSSWCLGFVCGE